MLRFDQSDLEGEDKFLLLGHIDKMRVTRKPFWRSQIVMPLQPLTTHKHLRPTRAFQRWGCSLTGLLFALGCASLVTIDSTKNLLIEYEESQRTPQIVRLLKYSWKNDVFNLSFSATMCHSTIVAVCDENCNGMQNVVVSYDGHSRHQNHAIPEGLAGGVSDIG